MTAYVLGHGWYDSSKPQTPVPAGMTVTFLAEQDMSGLQHVQLAQLLIGGVSAAASYSEGDLIPNYEFKPLDDEWIARLYQLNVQNLDLWLIGPDVPAFALCTGGKDDDGEDVCAD